MDNSMKKVFQIIRHGEKLTVVANSIKELLSKGAQTFGINITNCVLASTGFKILEDEVLMNISLKDTLMLLSDEEEWVEDEHVPKIRQKEDLISCPQAQALTIPEENVGEVKVEWNDVEMVYDIQHENESMPDPDEACKLSNDNISLNENGSNVSTVKSSNFVFHEAKEIIKIRPLPQFVPKLRLLLDQALPGLLKPSIFNSVFQQTVEYYRDLIPNFKGYGGLYDLIAQKMVLEYPSLQRGGQNDDKWSSFKDSCGRRMRYLRYSESGTLAALAKKKKLKMESHTAKKTEEDLVEDDNRKTPPIQSDRFQIVIDESSHKCTSLKSYDEFNDVIKLINMHYQKFSLATNVKIKHDNFLAVNVGLEEIFQNLTVFFVSEGNLSTILEKLPCMANGDLWLFLWGLLMEDSDLLAPHEAFSKFEKVICKLSNVKNANMSHLENFVYEETKINKGSGTKTKSVIEYHDDVPFDKYEKYLSCSERDAMKIVVFRRGGEVNKTDIYHAVYIVGQNTKIHVPGNNLKTAFFVLFATYYLLSLNYPKIYAQVLGFMQTYAFCISSYKLVKSTGYLRLCTKYEDTQI